MVRMVFSGLRAWETIEGKRPHGYTFPMAIVGAVMEDAGYAQPPCWEGEGPTPQGPWDLIMLSAMDPRHFWEVTRTLAAMGVSPWRRERGEADPIVLLGGQAASAPAPLFDLVDVVYVGEAEAGLAALLTALEPNVPRQARLHRAAGLPGVWVPAVHGLTTTVQTVWADDIGISLRRRLDVNHTPMRRLEIARGCKGPAGTVSPSGKNAACGFCVLGWRSPYRENSADDIAATMSATKALGLNTVHLSAGDAEGHSEIVAIRQAQRGLELYDQGWTGRMDTIRDCHVQAGKQYAIGMEGASARIRRAVGKPRLTHEYVVQKVQDYWRAGGERLMFHFIGGWPSEGPQDWQELDDLFADLANVAASATFAPGQTDRRKRIEIGRQPFNPMPHTPFQWWAPGLVTDGIGSVLARWQGWQTLNLEDKVGQQPGNAALNAVVLRGGPEVGRLLVEGQPSLRAGTAGVESVRAWLRQRGFNPQHYLGPLPLSRALPWAFIKSGWPVEEQERNFRRACASLGVPVLE